MRDVNAWMQEHCNWPFESVSETRTCHGGGKAMEAPLYAAAIDYLPLDDLLVHLRQVVWEQPDCVQLIVRGQDDDIWRIVAA